MIIGNSNVGRHRAEEGRLTASMDGVVVEIEVTAGDEVGRGQLVMVLESMKMESHLVAPEGGVIENVCVEKGDSISTGQVLAVLKSGA